ncbi:MAG: DUF4417 domain-containing protein [Oscillospiraceae bacterium]|nr:DUF4417 domain-containing protein [Oscillospiraceae bacterium]
MSNKNFSARSISTDCVNARLVRNAEYSRTGLPLFKCSSSIPTELISFKNAAQSKDAHEWVHFYEKDDRLELIWESPELWVKRLKRFKGIISPDLSIYRDDPPYVQGWNTYRNRVLAHYFSEQGYEVIPNIRFGAEKSYRFCFDGVEPNKPVCVSTLGILSEYEDRKFFQDGFAEMMRQLSPSTVIVYGQMPGMIFGEYQAMGIPFIHFDTDAQKARKRGES